MRVELKDLDSTDMDPKAYMELLKGFVLEREERNEKRLRKIEKEIEHAHIALGSSAAHGFLLTGLSIELKQIENKVLDLERRRVLDDVETERLRGKK